MLANIFIINWTANRLNPIKHNKHFAAFSQSPCGRNISIKNPKNSVFQLNRNKRKKNWKSWGGGDAAARDWMAFYLRMTESKQSVIRTTASQISVNIWNGNCCIHSFMHKSFTQTPAGYLFVGTFFQKTEVFFRATDDRRPFDRLI